MSGGYLLSIWRAFERCLLGGSGRCLKETGQVKLGQGKLENVKLGYVKSGKVHYNPSSLIPLARRGIRLLGKLNLQFCDLCKARAHSGLDE